MTNVPFFVILKQSIHFSSFFMDIPPTGTPQPAPQAPSGSPAPKPANKKLLIIIVAAVLGLSLLGWIGQVIVGNLVGYGLKKAIESSTGVSVDERGGTVTFKGKDGATATFDDSGSGKMTFKDETGKTVEIETQAQDEAKTLPKNFPQSFPVMAGMDIESTYAVASSEGASTFTVTWATTAAIAQVGDYYEKALKDAGWKVTSTTSADEGVYLSFERGAEDALQKDGGWMTVSSGEAGTQVSVYLTVAGQ
jgi:hypothetical protein